MLFFGKESELRRDSALARMENNYAERKYS